MIRRRDFLKTVPLVLAPGGLEFAAAAFVPAADRAASEKPVVKRYSALGRTGLTVSDIGFGVAISTDPQLLVEAFHRGVNYFDISPLYSWSVDMLAAAFAKDARMRSEAIVASKLECESLFDNFTPDAVGRREQCVNALLKRLGRSHVDILQLHSIGEGGRKDLEWLDPNAKVGAEVRALFERLKAAGKIRCAGATSHGPKLLAEAMEQAVAADWIDMIMPALNFRQTPELRAHLTQAAARRVGVIAMKVLANARQAKLQPLSGRPFMHAAIAWALSKPGVNGAVFTIKDQAGLDEHLGASGLAPQLADAVRLAAFALATRGEHCVAGCGRCAAACPHGVDVPSLLRIDQYWTNYELPPMAAERFTRLPAKDSYGVCESCASPVCQRACPHGVAIRRRVGAALARLTIGEGTPS
jgi:aryl-alcohol dehydrogenase-like predicted oxidoreductase